MPLPRRPLWFTAFAAIFAGCSPLVPHDEPRALEPQLPPPVESADPVAHAPASAEVQAPPSATPSPEAAPAPAPPPPKGTVVLHVGDSFVHSGLTQQLRKRLEPLGVRYHVRAEQSTNSFDWAKRVPGEVAASQPDLVIVTLGGNEIGSKHLDAQARAARAIVKAIGGRPCVWTTPPLWMEESGLFDMLQENIAPCRFFETDVLVGSYIPRRSDKIHPTMEGGGLWADKLYDWLMAERTGETDRPWALKSPPPSELEKRGKRGPLPK